MGILGLPLTLSIAAPPRLFFEIDIRELLSSVVAHDKTGVAEFFGGPGRREAAGGQCRPS